MSSKIVFNLKTTLQNVKEGCKMKKKYNYLNTIINLCMAENR